MSGWWGELLIKFFLNNLLANLRSVLLFEILMNLPNVDSEILAKILRLARKEDRQMAKVQATRHQIASILASDPALATLDIEALKAAGSKRGRRPGRTSSDEDSPYGIRRRRSPRSPKGFMKSAVTELLKAAGEAGMKVKEISEKVGKPSQNIHVWFGTTGKKLDYIEKIGESCYRLKPGVEVPEVPSVLGQSEEASAPEGH